MDLFRTSQKVKGQCPHGTARPFSLQIACYNRQSSGVTNNNKGSFYSGFTESQDIMPVSQNAQHHDSETSQLSLILNLHLSWKYVFWGGYSSLIFRFSLK